jgi:site-specific recombinase XerD
VVVGQRTLAVSRAPRPTDPPELRLFVLSRTVSNCQPRTIQTYLYHIRRFIAYVNKPLTQVTKADVELWLLSLKEKERSPAYLRSVHRNLCIFFNWMVAEEMIPRSPMHNMPRPRVPRRGKEFLSREDFDRLLAVCPANDFRGARNIAWLWLLWSTGCRLDGLVKLKLKDLGWRQGRISVVEKGDKQRYVPFTKEAQRAVYRYIKARRKYLGKTDRYEELWIGEERRPMTYHGLQKVSRILQERAGVHIKDQHHIFRRTWLYRNVKAGTPLKMLQIVGGWSDLATLDGYIRAMDSEDAIDQVNWQ